MSNNLSRVRTSSVFSLDTKTCGCVVHRLTCIELGGQVVVSGNCTGMWSGFQQCCFSSLRVWFVFGLWLVFANSSDGCRYVFWIFGDCALLLWHVKCPSMKFVGVTDYWVCKVNPFGCDMCKVIVVRMGHFISEFRISWWQMILEFTLSNIFYSLIAKKCYSWRDDEIRQLGGL